MKSFLICSGSHFHRCLPNSSVTTPKADIILIYKFISSALCASTHSNEETWSWETQTHVDTNMQMQSWCSAMWIQTIFFTSLGPFRHHSREFCFSLNPFKEEGCYWVVYESRKSLALHFILTCNNFFLQRSSLSRALLSFLFPCSFSLAVCIDLVLLSYTPAICFSSTSISFTESSVYLSALTLTHMQTHRKMHPSYLYIRCIFQKQKLNRDTDKRFTYSSVF